MGDNVSFKVFLKGTDEDEVCKLKTHENILN